MREPSASEARGRLGVSYALDRLWRDTMGLPSGDTKEGPLRAIASVLDASSTPYAIIGGVAMQLHSQEPRTTLDIDVAVRRFVEIPREALIAAGFVHEGRHAHSDNWRAPGAGPIAQRTAVQFSFEDERIETAVARARVVDGGGYPLRIAGAADLLALKLAAAEDPARRPSKRRQDLMDLITLVEQYPDVSASLEGLQPRVDRLTQTLMRVGGAVRKR